MNYYLLLPLVWCIFVLFWSEKKKKEHIVQLEKIPQDELVLIGRKETSITEWTVVQFFLALTIFILLLCLFI